MRLPIKFTLKNLVPAILEKVKGCFKQDSFALWGLLVEKTTYSLADAKATQDKDGKTVKVLTVPMVYKTTDGIEIIKTFTFKEGNYPVVVNHKVINRSAGAWQGQMFGQLPI